MPKTKEFDLGTRQVIIALKAEGFSNTYIGRRIGCHRTTVGKLVDKLETEPTLKNRIGRGRSRILGSRDMTRIKILLKRHRRQGIRKILKLFNVGRDKGISLSTLRRYIKKTLFVYRVLKKANMIRKINRKIRVKWCKNRLNLDNRDWRKWIFSDESMVVVGLEPKVRIWREKYEKYGPQQCAPKEDRKFSVMVWGGITYSGHRILIRVKGNIDSDKYEDTLRENLPTLIAPYVDGNYVFQQDNARVHTSGQMTTFFHDNAIITTSWPAQSPDLNIIENVWKMVKEDIKHIDKVPRNADELFEMIHDAWLRVPSEKIKELYESMPKRLDAVIKMKGYMSRY